MKGLFSVLIFLLLAGCGHAQITEWQDQDFVLCGNKFCDAECRAKVANAACSAGWQVKGGFNSSTVTGASFDGAGNMSLNRSNRSCSKLHCMGPLFKNSSSAE